MTFTEPPVLNPFTILLVAIFGLALAGLFLFPAGVEVGLPG